MDSFRLVGIFQYLLKKTVKICIPFQCSIYTCLPDSLIYRTVDKIYVHKTREFDISILELNKAVPIGWALYPAIFSQAPLNIDNGRLHLAVEYTPDFSKTLLRRMKIPIWSKDKCDVPENHKNLTSTDDFFPPEANVDIDLPYSYASH